MNVERAREILDPEHRENYDGMEAVNEACRMARDALEYLHNEDGNEQNFCGQCGQAIEWR